MSKPSKNPYRDLIDLMTVWEEACAQGADKEIREFYTERPDRIDEEGMASY